LVLRLLFERKKKKSVTLVLRFLFERKTKKPVKAVDELKRRHLTQPLMNCKRLECEWRVISQCSGRNFDAVCGGDQLIISGHGKNQNISSSEFLGMSKIEIPPCLS